MDSYTVKLIVVGDEILRGQVIDTNTSYLAQNLRNIGVTLSKVAVVPDIVDEIAAEVLEASKSYDLVFTSGGVGPTHDDVTYEAVAVAFGLELKEKEELLEFYSSLLPEKCEAKRLCIVPQPCHVIYVKSSEDYAVIKAENVYVLPGSPKYFKGAVDTIVPQLKGKTPLYIDDIDISIDELSIVNILDSHAKKWENKVKIGSYPQECGKPSVTRITFEGNKEDVIKAMEEFETLLADLKIMIIKNKFSHCQAQSIMIDEQTHVKHALSVLEQCYNRYKYDEVFLSFNGGKDCTVVLHLAAAYLRSRGNPTLLCLYVTGDPFPEVDSFVAQAASYYGVQLIRKIRPMRSALAELLNEKKQLKASLLGTRKGDPGSQNLEIFTPTDDGWPPLMRINPILNWTYEQVWQFILEHRIPYCSLYDHGYTSIGSKTTTVPNPLLKDPTNPSSYLPAYTLADNSAERQGRD